MEGRGAIKSYSFLPTQGTLLRKSCSGMPPPQDVGVGCLQRYNVSRGVTSSMCASRGMYLSGISHRRRHRALQAAHNASDRSRAKPRVGHDAPAPTAEGTERFQAGWRILRVE